MRRLTYGFAGLLLLFCSNMSLLAAQPANDFDRVLAPLLAERCLSCHSGTEPKGELDLSSKTTAMKGGENGAAVVAGKLDASLLWERVAADEMPPKKPLNDEEKERIKSWIESGAKWGSKEISPFRFTTENRAGYDWWSLQPLKESTPPKAVSEDAAYGAWRNNSIDRFVLEKLKENEIAPSPRANARARVRRLYYDLLGLPPDADELKKFEADPSDDAYASLVDRLLQSPHYGERWGRHWLDVARFGESDGFERNNPRKNAWHYRDWVIQALNNDMPYDEFVRMQLAGDIIRPGQEGAAAVGFLVAGVHNTVVGGSKRMKLLARQDELEEIIAAVGQTFLGLTVNCARCHDHKFDPIPTTDYYRMISSIDGVAHGERDVIGSDASAEIAKVDQQLGELRSELGEMDTLARKAILDARESSGELDKPDRPQAFASWDFSGAVDQVGGLKLDFKGNARVEAGALVVNGGADYAVSKAIDRDIAEKTLEAWVVLNDLDQSGGGAITLQTLDGEIFDSIVFAERDAKQWMAGSNGFVRTASFKAPQETEATKQPVHFAITYAADGRITGYRNGVAYGESYKTGLQKFEAGKAQVVFGLRHAKPGSNRMLKGRILRANLYDRALDAQSIAASAGVENLFVSEGAIVEWLPDGKRARREAIKSSIARAEQERNRLNQQQKSRMYTVSARTPKVMKVHVRGDVEKFGDEVSPRGVSAIAGADFGLPKNAPDPERRTKLAEWVTNKSNPLFARVIVNRVWHYHFGRGIVETPNDLGFNGGRPSNQELLDWLAWDFRENGYQLKRLHRMIVTSAAYQQSSKMNAKAFAKDADNRLIWRYSPRRVEAEVVRDSILKVANVLNPQLGGPGFEDVTSTSNNGTTYYEPVDPKGAAYNRRTVYRFTPRGGRSAVLDTFDCPDPCMAAPRRSVTTTPLQALALLNNSFVLRMADQLATRVESEAKAENLVAVAWQLTLNRDPSAEEAELAESLVKKHGLPTLCRALLNSNEFVVIE